MQQGGAVVPGPLQRLSQAVRTVCPCGKAGHEWSGNMSMHVQVTVGRNAHAAKFRACSDSMENKIHLLHRLKKAVWAAVAERYWLPVGA